MDNRLFIKLIIKPLKLILLSFDPIAKFYYRFKKIIKKNFLGSHQELIGELFYFTATMFGVFFGVFSAFIWGVGIIGELAENDEDLVFLLRLFALALPILMRQLYISGINLIRIIKPINISQKQEKIQFLKIKSEKILHSKINHKKTNYRLINILISFWNFLRDPRSVVLDVKIQPPVNLKAKWHVKKVGIIFGAIYYRTIYKLSDTELEKLMKEQC